MRILLLIFLLFGVGNFIGMVECKDWEKDEKYWIFALAMSMLGAIIVLARI